VDKNFSVSFVLPMFNEADNIERTINTLKGIAGKLTDEYEIVIADDASTDDSVKIVTAAAEKDPCIKLFCLQKNTKFGGAFAKGFKGATKDVIVYMDSDLPVGEDDVKASFSMIDENDIVTGYSKIKKGETFLRKIISFVYNSMVQTLFGLSVRDINSGYKVVKRSLIDDIEFISLSPFIDVELFIHAAKKNAKVYQYPLVFLNREGGKSYIARLPVILATFRDMIKLRILLKRG
jgi:glycosyltransferase involved in cell wall biosynthesis